MGFFAGELEHILRTRVPALASPWTILTRANLHPQRIERLKRAAEDISQTTTLPLDVQQQLRRELDLTATEWARLQAADEADKFMRLFIEHHYPLEEAVNKANAVFASALKDRLASGDLVIAQLSDGHPTAPPPARGRRRQPPPPAEGVLQPVNANMRYSDLAEASE
ncbi:MAG: hypothetical protein H0X24_23455 [Ktedonobacterales bacterium]|nr:hypothetical protein [Ktedonobacterales bacterium]